MTFTSKVRKLLWLGNIDKQLPYDIFSECVLGTRYQIGQRGESIWLWGNGLHKVVESLEQAKEIAQRDFEELITKQFLTE